MMLEWQDSGLSRLDEALEIEWQPWDEEQLTKGILLDEGCFTSPFANHLPEGCRDVRFLFVRRADSATELPPTRAIYVHMAATGTTTYSERLRCLAIPLLQSGIASCLLMAPYNGTRSPRGQDLHYIDNVADYMRQSMAVILEGTVLIRTLASGFGPRFGERYDAGSLVVGVTGVSWGGAMAACTALTSKLPVACMVGLGSDSPRVMASGILSWQVCMHTPAPTPSAHGACHQVATNPRLSSGCATLDSHNGSWIGLRSSAHAYAHHAGRHRRIWKTYSHG